MKSPFEKLAIIAMAFCFAAVATALADEPPVELRPWLGSQEWKRDTDGPILSLGKSGEFDDTHIFAPTVAREGGRFRLWYCGSQGFAHDLAPVRTRDERVFRLGLAESDDGRQFDRHAGAVLELDEPKRSIVTPTVLRDARGNVLREEGKLRMWFTSATLGGGGPPHAIQQAVSLDGVKWTDVSPIQISRAYCPTVVKTPQGYTMWYTEPGKYPWVIRHATSPDGSKWSVTEQPVLTISQPWEHDLQIYPCVLHIDGVYLMWYASYLEKNHETTAIGFAASTDGITWHKHSANPILRSDPARPWETHYVSSHSVMQLDDGRFRIWYASRKAPPFHNLYFAINTAIWNGPAKSPDRAQAPSPFRIEHSVILTSPQELHFAQSRAALIPSNPPRVLLTTQQIEKVGSHGYRDLFAVETSDGGKTWSLPESIESLKRKRMPEGHDLVIGDVCPQWHAATGVVLATGKTFGFDGGTKENRGFERVSYATYSPATKQWSGLKLLALPKTDHEGKEILEPNAGCHQRFDLPNGEILLPIRYRKDPQTRHYTTIVARCTFDGDTLTYREHGSEFTIPRERGLYEPSVTGFQGRYFLTKRADHSAFVARGKDGLNYEPFIEWAYDDGKILGSYNAQQHWVAHSDALYLIYTRRGANNDHVFRHRAPLFIARVDPDRLCVLRETEQILMPETGLDLAGGFGVLDISPGETWVVSSEMGFPKNRLEESNRIRLAKILWTQPNKLIAPTKPTH